MTESTSSISQELPYITNDLRRSERNQYLNQSVKRERNEGNHQMYDEVNLSKRIKMTIRDQIRKGKLKRRKNILFIHISSSFVKRFVFQ